MPCYADTIIKIKHVNQNEKDTKVPSVWALGTYPPGCDDNDIEMIAAVSTHVTIANKVPNSNKCPLKISLIGIPQEIPVEIKNTQDSVVETFISDYVKVDAENAEDDNVDDAENAEDNNVDDIEDHQPKMEESVRENPNSETNIKGKKSSGKNKKHSTRNSKR
ncbi:hypothetical protein C2G38_2299295 [Gigaspora rosea]|uniref:Uncharacterized protein n=1 Tax=Gigaspora rosea TaxID=44941 RepID=A0A397VR58_9GLOM|nr:hypothetical protein C2G38_2299295 [Gigaspora rosea]